MYILAALALVGVLWFAFKPGWAEKAEEMYLGIRGWFKFRKDTRELAKQFKTWVTDAPPAKRAELYSGLPASADGFAEWLSKLSEKELEQFTQRVALFCASLKFDIAWLTNSQVSREPELKKAVEDAVLLYSLATWRASSVEIEVKGFLAYQAWLAHPNRHKKFGSDLHRLLVQRGLVKVPTELYLASEDERQEQAIAAIITAADENHAAFNEALRHLQTAGLPEVDAPKPASPEPVKAEAVPPAAPAPKAAAAKSKTEVVAAPQTTPA